MRNLVDTDWAIDYLNQRSRAVQLLNGLYQDGIGISLISVAELYHGALNSYNPESSEQALLKFLDTLTIVDLDVPICRIFGIERARLRAAGTPIDNMDLLIGATALRHNLTLVTNNRRHFERMQGLDIISE